MRINNPSVVSNALNLTTETYNINSDVTLGAGGNGYPIGNFIHSTGGLFLYTAWASVHNPTAGSITGRLQLNYKLEATYDFEFDIPAGGDYLQNFASSVGLSNTQNGITWSIIGDLAGLVLKAAATGYEMGSGLQVINLGSF